jgi:hypothetical protein
LEKVLPCLTFDREVTGVVDHSFELALGVVVRQTGEDRVEDLAAADLVGVGGSSGFSGSLPLTRMIDFESPPVEAVASPPDLLEQPARASAPRKQPDAREGDLVALHVVSSCGQLTAICALVVECSGILEPNRRSADRTNARR